MKKSILLIVSAIIIAMSIQSCSNADASMSVTESKPSSDSTSLHDQSLAGELRDMGFSNSVSVTIPLATEEKEFWANRGLVYWSIGEIHQMMSENNWVIAQANRYTGHIPQEAAEKIVAGRNIVKNEPAIQGFFCPDGRYFTDEQISKLPSRDAEWVKTGTRYGSEIMVIAPITKFNTEGTTLVDLELKEPHPDPVVVVRLRDGYVELARW